MRTLLVVLVGLGVVAGVGATAVAVMPTSDGDPIRSIRVDAPQRIQPVLPAPPDVLPNPPSEPPPTVPTPAVAPPPPAPSAGVAEPPPAVWRGDDADDWDDDADGDDDGDDD
ncbi:hypothetical protein ACFQWH_02605 [Mycolicibacterium sp. GCM10028919]|uniref:hypothetical protein n=1 Tax=Mycolicibacterium sp. GCM10028919 TaxID=3273401 RepID=UPI003619CD16